MAMTKCEIIDETIEFYSKNPRAVRPDEECYYYNTDGTMCAVGRCFNEEVIRACDSKIKEVRIKERYNSAGRFSVIPEVDFNFMSGCSLDHNVPNDSMFQEKYKGYNGGFWGDLQKLHDNNDFWDGKELSDMGQNYASELRAKYA